MKLQVLVGALACALTGAITPVTAAELPDCNLEGGVLLGSRILERLRPTSDAATFLNISGKLRNGEGLTFSKDEALMAWPGLPR